MNPLDVIAQLVLEDGRTWADAATDGQVQAMTAWLADSRPFHFDTRSRGFAKTSDVAALVLGVLATDPVARVDWLAADQEQGRLSIDSIEGYLSRSPSLALAFVVTANRVSHVGGGRLEILAADAAGAWGRRPSWLVVDEIANWSETPSSTKLWRAMSTSLTKVPGARCVVITSAGNPRHFAFKILEHARGSEMWRACEVPGPPPWVDPRYLADQRQSLPPAIFDQLYENVWSEPEGDFLDPLTVDAAFTREGPALRADPERTYVAGLDLGAVNDASVLMIGHREGDRTVLDRQLVWQGRRGAPVDFSELGRAVFDLHREFRFSLSVDPWQAYELIDKLGKQGVDVRPFHFSPQSKMRLASTLLHAVNTGRVELYPADGLRDELVALRVVQKDAGMFAFDHSPGEHDDRSVALALMLIEAIEHGEGGDFTIESYGEDPFAPGPVSTKGDLRLVGSQYLDETDETDMYGEPLRELPPGWKNA